MPLARYFPRWDSASVVMACYPGYDYYRYFQQSTGLQHFAPLDRDYKTMRKGICLTPRRKDFDFDSAVHRQRCGVSDYTIEALLGLV